MSSDAGAGVAALVEPGELEAAALADAWRRLAEARSNPFLTPEWTSAWLRTHPDDSPFVLVWRRDGELRGVLPLARVRIGPARILAGVGARRADWMTPACAEADEEQMAAACAELLAAERGWQALRFDRLAEESAWPRALAAAGGLSLAPPRRRDVLPYIEFDERGYDGYLADRSRNFRSQLGRRRRRLERDHGLAFRRTENAGELEADLDSFFRLHDARWQRRGGSSSADVATREHQRLFAAAALERGWLRLWIAEAGGAPAAAWYGWRVGDRYCYALAGLDPAYEEHALGTVLLGHTIEQAAAEGARIYDMMWGDEGYKKRFETGRRHASTWLLSRRGSPSRLAVESSVRAARAAESLPPGLKEPLAKLAGRRRGT